MNYEDPDINVAIPVFSIHGNHDDPTGEGHLAALDLLQIGGLVNYYGRTHESDNIQIKPILLQKGRTKLALYGMSNVRDERLFRTFRDGKVKFFQPSQQKSDWFNLMSVHQNRFVVTCDGGLSLTFYSHAYTDTGYLPENFLPNWMDLVIWGHEHESLIYPQKNAETEFDVIQPGSTVATSLVPGEAEPKQVTILSVTGRDYKSEPIRLKTPRPFKYKDIALAEDEVTKKLPMKENNRAQISKRLKEIIKEMIREAQEEWEEAQDPIEDEELEDAPECPLPLIRLRVEYTAPEGGKFDCENPQRLSNEFTETVANSNDVVYFWRRKKGGGRKGLKGVEIPEGPMMDDNRLDTVKIEKLVREYLTAQSLTILPRNEFGSAVTEFVDKDNKYAMEHFVVESLNSQVQELLTFREGEDDEEEADDIHEQFEAVRTRLEEAFDKEGGRKIKKQRKLKPKPDDWMSDSDYHWEDQPAALVLLDNSGEKDGSGDDDVDKDDEDDALSVISAPTTKARGRGRGRGRGGTTGTSRATASKKTASKKAASATKSTGGRPKKKVEEEDEDSDVVMDRIEDQDNSQLYPLFVKPSQQSSAKPAPTKRQPARKAATAASRASSRTGVGKGKAVIPISDDDDDDDDAFEPTPMIKAKGRR